MYWGNGYVFGMSFIWWLFWAVLLVSFFALMTPVSRRRYRFIQDTPLEILRRRFAAGAMTAEDYEARRVILERDEPNVVSVPPSTSSGREIPVVHSH